jgi:hypothetical protein
MRGDRFEQVRGFNLTIMAGEEPEVCSRWRAVGRRTRRLDCELTPYDAATTPLATVADALPALESRVDGVFHRHGAAPERN